MYKLTAGRGGFFSHFQTPKSWRAGRYITIFTKFYSWILSRASWIQPTTSVYL